jgi:hypothetical protein
MVAVVPVAGGVLVMETLVVIAPAPVISAVSRAFMITPIAAGHRNAGSNRAQYQRNGQQFQDFHFHAPLRQQPARFNLIRCPDAGKGLHENDG